ncbi:MAG: adenylosuccinate lyase, partial [Treponema sp.]|nr:adenylosuccinate lyase [Treponema sp.]
QRDLTNSASQRFIADYVAGFCMAVSRMKSVIEGLSADRERLAANLRGGNIPGGIFAEPAYILLAESGVQDAHELIRRITLKAEKEKLSFAAALSGEPEVLTRIGAKMLELGLINSMAEKLSFFEHPENYSGLAAKKARRLAQKYRKLMERRTYVY